MRASIVFLPLTALVTCSCVSYVPFNRGNEPFSIPIGVVEHSNVAARGGPGQPCRDRADIPPCDSGLECAVDHCRPATKRPVQPASVPASRQALGSEVPR